MSRATSRVNAGQLFAALVLTVCAGACAQADVPPDPTISLDTQFSRISALPRTTGEADNVIAKFKAFADEHPDHDLAAEAHLEIVDLLLRKRDITAAIDKTKWVIDRFPKATKRQYPSLGDMPSTMGAEWKEYVKTHPILIKDYAWYKLADMYRNAGHYEAALQAYDHVLATVRPDEIPDTKNLGIVTTFRLHKGSLQAKIILLEELARTGKMRNADVKRVSSEAECEKLYPKALWRRLERQAASAYTAYVEESKKKSQPDNGVHE